MKRKSVIFIEPSGSKVNVFNNFMKLPLMGSLYLGTILYNSGYQVRILNENILGREIDPFEIDADVFCITALTVSAARARLLADQLKSIHPESKVIIGGIHATLLPEEFTDVADHVVTGEAEEIIVDVIEGRYTEKIISGSRTKDIENLPLINYELLEEADNIGVVPLMTSRGCPFDCTFCTVTKVFGHSFRNQSAERVVAEMENALAVFKNKSFFFYDDNFTANRKRVYELCDLMIEKKLKITWAAQVRLDLARDPELIDKMVETAFDRGDLDLAASLLDESEENHKKLLEKVDAAKDARDNREKYLERQARLFRNVLQVIVRVNIAKNGLNDYFETSSRLAVKLSKKMGVSEEKIKILKMAFVLRMIGIMGIHLPNPREQISEEQMEIYKTHPNISHAILEPVPGYDDMGIKNIIQTHYERWDGKGPRGIKGEDIPIESRAIEIAETFVLMRCPTLLNQKAGQNTLDEDLSTLEKKAGNELDPNLVPVFIEMIREEEQEEKDNNH